MRRQLKRLIKISIRDFWEDSKEYRKKTISHIEVYVAIGPKWTFSLIFEIFSKIP